MHLVTFFRYVRGVLGAGVIGTVAMCGCVSTVRINKGPTPTADAQKTAEGKTTKVKGVPFYVKVARCKQETSWLQPVYTLTLKKTTTYQFVDEQAAKKANPNAELPAPVVRTATKTLSLSQFTKNDVTRLRELLSKPGEATPEDIIDTLWNKVASWPDYVAEAVDEDALTNSKDVFEISNTSMPEAIVDYGTTYYYNAPRPWVGSSQIGAKLAPDGTLTEGSAQVQSQTLSTILSALPITTLLTKAVPAAPELAAAAATVQKVPPQTIKATTRYELTVAETGYIHTHSKYVGFRLACQVEPNGVRSDYALTIQKSGQATAKKDESKTVKINGSVVLPKAAANK